MATATRRVRAYNTATASDNKIHDDAVARRFGFGGGLVPGVDVYAYMAHVPAARWGLDWLERGTMSARFHQPVYDGEQVTIAATEPAGERPALELEVRNETGELCASGTATLPGTSAPTAPPASHWRPVAPAADPPPASPDALPVGRILGIEPHRFVGSRAGEYLDDVREDLPLFRDGAFAHPGWILRDANHVLARNVLLGPWIHVGSEVQHHRAVRDSDMVACRAVVTGQWERKGHRFVELDVGVLAGDEVAARIRHTAIYRPRQVD